MFQKKSTLSLGALITLVATLSSASFAASSGTLSLQGVVALTNDIVITPNGSNNLSLNILSGESAKNIAAVAETSNDPLGYVINLSSTNAGVLKNGATVGTSYTISYNGGAYSAPSSTPTTVKTISSLTGLTSNNSAVLINVVANPNALAGTYTDTLTLSIVAN